MRFWAFTFLLFIYSPLSAQKYDTVYVHYGDSVAEFFDFAITKALDQGIISKSLKKKQPAQIKYLNKSFPAKIRLKGDWTDHVKKDQWSLRVNLKSGNIFHTDEFSLQFPETRGGENERLFHEELKKRGVLTTYYTYVHVVVNEVYWGLFAFEEHFDEPLVDRNMRPAGPLLKFDEDGFWECQLAAKNTGENACVEYPIFDAARIVPFGKKKTYRDTVKLTRFYNAREILKSWRNGHLNKNNIDLERFAQYYAMCDVFGFYHGLQWHNQRFYYRPIDGKIEPVAFDCYSKDNALIGKDLLGQFDGHYDTVYFNELWFNYQLFNIPEFVTSYQQCLAKSVADKEYLLQNATPEIGQRIEARLELVQKYLDENATIPIIRYYPYENWKNDHPEQVKQYGQGFDRRVLPSVQLTAEVRDEGEVKKVLTVKNNHIDSLWFIGYELPHRFVYFSTPKPIGPQEEFKFLYGVPKRVFATEVDGGDTLRVKVDHNISNIDASAQFGDWQDYFEKSGNVWRLKKEKLSLNERIELPADKEYILEDVRIDFGENGLIVCHGDMEIHYSTLRSEVKGNNGLRIIDGCLYVNSAIIEGFSISQMESNGPLQAYNSDILVGNLSVTDIEAEDAINFVFSDVMIHDAQLERCSGDGIDLDYCSGTITDSYVHNCSGDGMDFSRSHLDIYGSGAIKCGDKGYSIGESSIVNIVNCLAQECPTGIAVKDGSFLSVEDMDIYDCPTPIHAFRKKDFYLVGGRVHQDDDKYEVKKDEFSIVTNE